MTCFKEKGVVGVVEAVIKGDSGVSKPERLDSGKLAHINKPNKKSSKMSLFALVMTYCTWNLLIPLFRYNISLALHLYNENDK